MRLAFFMKDGEINSSFVGLFIAFYIVSLEFFIGAVVKASHNVDTLEIMKVSGELVRFHNRGRNTSTTITVFDGKRRVGIQVWDRYFPTELKKTIPDYMNQNIIVSVVYGPRTFFASDAHPVEIRLADGSVFYGDNLDNVVSVVWKVGFFDYFFIVLFVIMNIQGASFLKKLLRKNFRS